MRRYYAEKFGADTVCIGYGSDVPRPTRSGMLDALGLRPREYLLLVGRLVPENCAHHLVDAYERIRPSLKCVVVGDAPYVSGYIANLKRCGPNVIFPGYVFGDGYRELLYNAYAVVLCSEVGGAHPVLLEAMAAGNCVIVNDTPVNLEVIADSGLQYAGIRGASGLRDVLADLVGDEERVEELRRRAAARARECYSWDRVIEEYGALFRRLTGGDSG